MLLTVDAHTGNLTASDIGAAGQGLGDLACDSVNIYGVWNSFSIASISIATKNVTTLMTDSSGSSTFMFLTTDLINNRFFTSNGTNTVKKYSF